MSYSQQAEWLGAQAALSLHYTLHKLAPSVVTRLSITLSPTVKNSSAVFFYAFLFVSGFLQVEG